jgi:thiol-disulfide isomerase/thioredoxin/outer membrane lipoprotein-sorting protein
MTSLALAVLLALQASAAPQAAATDVLRALIQTEDSARAVSYVVRRDYLDDALRSHKGRSTVLLQKAPFRVRAAHYGEDGSLLDLTVSDEKTTHASSPGQSEEAPTFVSDGSGSMIVVNDAGIDVAMTWNVLLNPDFLRKAIASGKALVIWQGEIDADVCNVVFYGHDERADFYWFSTKTGLPRAVLRMNTLSGHAKMTALSVIEDIDFNPPIGADAFTFTPIPAGPAASQGKQPAAAAQVPLPSLVGRRLPALEVRDPGYKPFTLSEFNGKPALITFWAPWCGPCVGELAALAKLQPSFGNRLQVLAIAVQAKRQEILKFIQEHPDYPFRFFTDPDLQDQSSRLSAFFGVEGSSGVVAIPVSVFTDSHGTIVSEWGGFESIGDLRERLTHLLVQVGGSK